MMRLLPLMTSCHSSLVLPFSGVLILVSPLMSLLSSIICFFRISCHFIWPISHLHIIPIERFAFLYALVTDASICFPTLFISTLVKVYRSSSKGQGLFILIFIYRILLDLGLEDFLAFEPVHIIAPICATFLRQRATRMTASSKRPHVESSIGDAF